MVIVGLSVLDVILCLIGTSVSENNIYGTFAADEDLSPVFKLLEMLHLRDREGATFDAVYPLLL